MKPIDITSRDLEIAKTILAEHVPEYEVRAFGSRVNWTAKEYSDLDLAVMTDKPLPIRKMARLKDAFSESDLPFKVDVVDWAATGDNFQGIIQSEYETIQKGTRARRGRL
jgi:type I restriction enzyme S subunit